MGTRRRSSELPLYNADPEYIEEKYVRAEEERARREEEERRRRAAEEEEARRQAEKSRIIAEQERKRKKEEAERIRLLEEARQKREAEEKRRKEQEAALQRQLDDIEDEISSLEQKKAELAKERLITNRDLNDEENDIKRPLEILQQRRAEIAEEENKIRRQLKDFENRSRQLRLTLEQKEVDLEGRLKELTIKRRDYQNEMLRVFQTGVSDPAPITRVSDPAPTAQNERGAASYPSTSLYGQKTALQDEIYPIKATSTKNAQQPGVEIVSTPSKPRGPGQASNDLQQQIGLLDEFLATGVLTRAEYEDAKKKAIEDARAQGITLNPAPPAPSNNNIAFSALPSASPSGQSSPSVEAQIAQLDEFLRQGVLNRAEYEDAKNKVLADAGRSNQPNYGGIGKTTITVQAPPGVSPGNTMTVEHRGRLYNVVIPHGVRPGAPFNVSFPN